MLRKWDILVEQDPPLHLLPAYGALLHPVPTHLARPVAAQEDHVLQAVKADGAHGLKSRKYAGY